MAISWKQDKKWSDRFLPQIKMILGLHLIGEPPVEEDAERNTDLMVLRMDAVRVACRVRRVSYIQRYGDEFTLRAGRPSGAKTELTKVLEGWGDYFFYGFADEKEESLIAWTLADLRVFRVEFNRMAIRSAQGVTPGIGCKNDDNSSNFVAFKWNQFPSCFVVATTREQKVA